jgi:hypothetical protein
MNFGLIVHESQIYSKFYSSAFHPQVSQLTGKVSQLVYVTYEEGWVNSPPGYTVKCAERKTLGNGYASKDPA